MMVSFPPIKEIPSDSLLVLISITVSRPGIIEQVDGSAGGSGNIQSLDK